MLDLAGIDFKVAIKHMFIEWTKIIFKELKENKMTVTPQWYQERNRNYLKESNLNSDIKV